MKRCSASLIIKETQIKTIIRCHFTLLRMVIINKSTVNAGENVEKRDPLKLVEKNKTEKRIRDKNVEIHLKKKKKKKKKLKIELPYDPTLLLLGINLEKNENSNLKRYIHTNVHRSTIDNS